MKTSRNKESSRQHVKEIGVRNVCKRFVIFEVPVRAEAARMNDALREALVVEVKDLLPEVKIFERCRTAVADPQRVLIVPDAHALLRREVRSSESAR